MWKQNDGNVKKTETDYIINGNNCQQDVFDILPEHVHLLKSNNYMDAGERTNKMKQMKIKQNILQS